MSNSYGLSLPSAMVLAPSPNRGDCRVGFPFPGASPWGRENQYGGSTNPWFTVRSVRGTPEAPINQGGEPSGWGDHFLNPVGGWGDGADAPCAGIFAQQTTGTPPGECVHSKWWRDAYYAKVKGTLSLWKYQEARVRNLLARLAGGPIDGFGSYLSMLAYDSSFCLPVAVDWRLARALPRALTRFNQLWLPGRWLKQKKYKTLECPKEYCELSRWHDAGHTANIQKMLGATGQQATCSLAVSRAAPAYSGGVQTSQRWVSGRWIPAFAALEVVGGVLTANAWLGGLLECLDPGWRQATLNLPLATIKPATAPPKAMDLVQVVAQQMRLKGSRKR